MYRDSNMETYIAICKIDSQHNLLCGSGNSKQGLCINLEGWDGKGNGGKFIREGMYVYLWLILVEV